MKSKIHLALASILIAYLNISCLGERKNVALDQMGDTTFVNQNFKGNLIDFKEDRSACQNITVAHIAKLYGVTQDLIIIDDPLTNPNRRITNTPVCSFFIKTGSNDFEWLRGSIALEPEIGENEVMGDIAQATGSGENWQEAWALKKSMYKTVQWVQNTGMAALWNTKELSLSIKFEGYTLKVFPPKNKLNKTETALKRDYKKIALAIAKAGGYLN